MQIYIVFQNFTKYITTVCCSTKRSVQLYIQLLYIIRTTNAILFSISLSLGSMHIHAPHSSFIQFTFFCKKFPTVIVRE